jgi:aspartyl/asparaginyl beta-hydroxylase (cupin superfamily)
VRARAASLLADADRAVAARDLTGAEKLLQLAIEMEPGDFGIAVRLAGVCRAAGRPRMALQAINRALAITPLDFMALLMKASLLEGLDDPAAGEAWSHALAQKPDTVLPEQVQAVLAQGQTCHALWLQEKETRWKLAMAPAEATADDDERRRLARFRSNSMRRTRIYHSEPTDFHYPELTEREFHPRATFPWLETLEGATDVILSELQALLAAEHAEAMPYIQYADHMPLRQWEPLNHNRAWSAMHLLRTGQRVEDNARYCPQTLGLIDALPQPHIAGASPNAMFSLLAPHTHIPPHVGVNNARLVCHLPLVVPDGCWFRVGNETRIWERGRAWVFDDTIEHEAMNPTDALRIILIFDVWHPDLNPAEREGVAALIGASCNATPL